MNSIISRASASDRARLIRELVNSGVEREAESERRKRRWCRQYERMRDDHLRDCACRVEEVGCKVKKGGNE